MVVAQVIISLPFVIVLTKSSVEAVSQTISDQLRSLGATDRQVARSVLWEARFGVVVAIFAGFGRVISEVGAVMLVDTGPTEQVIDETKNPKLRAFISGGIVY
jgi:tungstate transport system permease protein